MMNEPVQVVGSCSTISVENEKMKELGFLKNLAEW
jgi:hypothetical protein